MKKSIAVFFTLLAVVPITVAGCGNTQATGASWAWEAWVAIGTLALAGATLGLVLWTIFGTKWREKQRKPKLRIELGSAHPDLLKIRYWYSRKGEVKNTYSYWVRPRISNEGIEPAEHVEVYLDKVWEKNKTTVAFELSNRHIPVNLRWATTDPKEERMEKKVFYLRINNGLDKHVNLCHVVNPKDRPNITGEEPLFLYQALDLWDYGNKNLLHFDTVMETANESSFWPVGYYMVKVIAAAGNAEMTYRYFDIDLRGEWFEEEKQMWQEGFVVRPTTEEEVIERIGELEEAKSK